MTQPSLLTRIDERTFAPESAAVGPWDSRLLFGGVPAGLAVHEVERQTGQSNWAAARITTDLVRPAPCGPLSVDVEIVREGARVVVATASIHVGPKLVSQSSLLLIPGGDEPDASNSPRSDDTPEQYEPTTILVPHASIFSVLEIRAGDIRTDSTRGWARLNADVVRDEPTSPLARAAVVADLAAGMTNTRGGVVEFINADVSLFLERVPAAGWLSIDLDRPELASGIAVASAALGDAQGPAGQAVMTSVRAVQAVSVAAAS